VWSTTLFTALLTALLVSSGAAQDFVIGAEWRNLK
jgi:hypothetical protein